MYFNYGTVNEILNNKEYNRNFDVDKLTNNNVPETGLDPNFINMNNDADNYRDISDHMYPEKKVPEEERLDPRTIELIHDPDYHPDSTRDIDYRTILYKDDVLIYTDDKKYSGISDDMVTSNNIIDGKIVIESPDEGIPVNQLNVVVDNDKLNLSDVQLNSMTNADLHNTQISNKKFSSKIQ